MVNTVGTPLSIAPSVWIQIPKSNTWYYSQIVVLGLGVLCVCFVYFFKVTSDTVPMQESNFKRKETQLGFASLNT